MKCKICWSDFPNANILNLHHCMPMNGEEHDSGMKFKAGENGIQYPSPDSNFYMRKRQIRATVSLLRLAETKPINVLLTGETGTGKTSFTQHLAGLTRRPYFLVNCGIMQEPQEWFGQMLFEPSRGTYYQVSEFVRALGTENCIICIDELNRSENPKVTNALMELLGETRTTWVDVIRMRFNVAHGVIFMATINEGSAYTGVDPLDIAMRGRFHVIPMSYPTRNAMVRILVAKAGLDEARAEKLMDVVGKGLTTEQLPTRALIVTAEHIVGGLTYEESLKLGFYGMLKTDSMRQLLQAAQLVLNERIPEDLEEEVCWTSLN